jgi:acyl-CoA hydrolase
MDWKDIYNEKHISVEEAAAKIESNDRIWFGACSSAPIKLLETISERYQMLNNVDLMTAMALYPYKFLQSPEYKGHLNFHTTFYGAYARKFYKAGNVNIKLTHLSKLDQTIRQFDPTVCLADVSLPDEDGYFYFGSMGVAANDLAAKLADKVIVQVNKHQPRVDGVQHRIHVSQVSWICEHDQELPILPQAKPSENDQKIAEIILPEIADGSTIQIGLGGLSNAIGYGLEDKNDLSVHTEMFTDSMVYLAKKGVIKPSAIGKNDNFVSINACLMVDLTGQVCSESIGFRQYSSTGGQLDYVRGAALSKGGKSFLCLPSVNVDKKGNMRSTISTRLPAGQVVTVPRTDVMYVVTEYGIADLYNKSISERVEALIAIAHPDFRESLRNEAIEAGLIAE